MNVTSLNQNIRRIWWSQRDASGSCFYVEQCEQFIAIGTQELLGQSKSQSFLVLKDYQGLKEHGPV